MLADVYMEQSSNTATTTSCSFSYRGDCYNFTPRLAKARNQKRNNSSMLSSIGIQQLGCFNIQITGEINMKAGVLLFVVRDVVTQLMGMGLLTPEGEFVTPTLNQDMELTAFVEQLLVKYGVTVPEEVDKIVQALPIVMRLIK